MTVMYAKKGIRCRRPHFVVDGVTDQDHPPSALSHICLSYNFNDINEYYKDTTIYLHFHFSTHDAQFIDTNDERLGSFLFGWVILIRYQK